MSKDQLKPDDLEEVLSPGPPREQMLTSEKVMEQARPVLRRRRWMRHGINVSGFVICFLAGMLTMSSMSNEPTEQAITLHWPEPDKAARPDEVAKSPLAQEWKAFDDTDNRAEKYREAGDRYLEERDVASALRCYRQALNSEGGETSVSTNSSWLYMALKHAREED